jgi:transposase InsO family protein
MAPNQLWCMDFKGFFRCGNKNRCDPFTIADAYSRYITRCQAVPKLKFENVDAICDAAMREHGLPERIRTDNGNPFATTGPLGLSKLSIKWGKLGIVHQRIDPGEPQQNGRHERMHRTIKLETATPPAFTLREQQSRFDEFRLCYNKDRPHEALAFATPDSVYVASARSYPAVLPEPEYGEQFLVRNVRKDGDIKLNGNYIFISGVLSHERIGLLKVEEELYELYLGDLLLGEVDTHWMTFTAVR